MYEYWNIDADAYHHRAQTGPCFVCGIITRSPEFSAHIVYEDDVAIAFLDKYPPLYGYVLVAPRDHRAQVTADFTIDDYLALQRRVYWIAEAVRQEVGAERVYLLSLGSNQGNAHVHWHIAPLPPGVPYREQQLAIYRLDRRLKIPEGDRAALAQRLRQRIENLADN